MELKITESNFEKEVMESEMPVLVDFYADWCGPCKMMAPIIAQLAEELDGKCKVGKCNIDENTNLASQYRVMSIPTIILFKNREKAFTNIGGISKNELKAKIEKFLEL